MRRQLALSDMSSGYPMRTILAFGASSLIARRTAPVELYSLFTFDGMRSAIRCPSTSPSMQSFRPL